MRNVDLLLFTDFMDLDAFGPVSVFACLEGNYRIGYYSVEGGMVKSLGEARLDTRPLREREGGGLLLVPGGLGTRALVKDSGFLVALRGAAEESEYVLSVCTGAALVARTGLLDGRRATSNKRAWDWVLGQGRGVDWIRKARWTVDGKYYSSSGVSAGIDMALGFLADRHGRETALSVSAALEHVWAEDPEADPFAAEADDASFLGEGHG